MPHNLCARLEQPEQQACTPCMHCQRHTATRLQVLLPQRVCLAQDNEALRIRHEPGLNALHLPHLRTAFHASQTESRTHFTHVCRGQTRSKEPPVDLQKHTCFHNEY